MVGMRPFRLPHLYLYRCSSCVQIHEFGYPHPTAPLERTRAATDALWMLVLYGVLTRLCTYIALHLLDRTKRL